MVLGANTNHFLFLIKQMKWKFCLNFGHNDHHEHANYIQKDTLHKIVEKNVNEGNKTTII